MRKKGQIIVVSVGIAVCGVILFFLPEAEPTGSAPNEVSHGSANTKVLSSTNGPSPDARSTDRGTSHIPSKAARRLMSSADQISLLEKLGCVPEDGELADFFLAEKTSWWGKRLDPDAFWKGRVLWYDASTQRDARRYGRAYPPIPYEDPSVAERSDEDRQVGVMSGESRTPRSFYSEREAVFWNRFANSHPKPPTQIQPWLETCASAFAYKAYLLESEPTTARKYRLGARDLSLESNLRDAQSSFYPHECVSPENYKWAYVMKKRKEYEEFKAAPWGSDSWQVSNFFSSVHVDRALITEPLTPEQIKAANAWQVAYLRRLRREKWDESYITAYKQAWNLTEEDISEPVAGLQ